MTTSNLPADGELRIGPVTLPIGQRVLNHSGDPVAWATTQPVRQAGRDWYAISALAQETGLVPILLAGLDGTAARPWDEREFDAPADIAELDQLDPVSVLAACWDESIPDEEEQAEEEGEADSAAAQRAPFGWQFPGLARPEQTQLSEAERIRALDSLPAARIGLIAASRPADALPLLGWIGAANRYGDSLPLATVLRSWEDRFGARLLEVGFAEIRLFVERPPRGTTEATSIAAEHYAFCDECGGHGLTTISEISASLINAPIWTFWWD